MNGKSLMFDEGSKCSPLLSESVSMAYLPFEVIVTRRLHPKAIRLLLCLS